MHTIMHSLCSSVILLAMLCLLYATDNVLAQTWAMLAGLVGLGGLWTITIATLLEDN